jgi:hypothetical protein
MKTSIFLLLILISGGVGFNPASVRLSQAEIMKIYQAGWDSGRMGQLSKQYFKTDINTRWKQDSINYAYLFTSHISKP